VVWNVNKVLDKEAEQFDPAQVGVTASRMPTLRSARKIDDLTVELTTSEPDAFLPINLTNLFMASPAHWAKKLAAVPASVTGKAERSKAAWTAFAADPSGTGPFKGALRAARAPGNGEEHRLLGPQAHAHHRQGGAAAPARGQLAHRRPDERPGGLDRSPAPDALDAIKGRGFKVYSNLQPHIWPWQFSFVEGSPWLDKRVRHAANLCVNRTSMKQLLGGMMVRPPACRARPPLARQAQLPDQVRRAGGTGLMQQAGYSASKP
jgi:ABC-type transport system substrate-binding protein